MHVCKYIGKVYGPTPAPEEDNVKVLKFDLYTENFHCFCNRWHSSGKNNTPVYVITLHHVSHTVVVK